MKIYSNRPEGNAFAIIGTVRKLFKETDRMDEWPAVSERMMNSDYANLCAVVKEVTFGSIEVVSADEYCED